MSEHAEHRQTDHATNDSPFFPESEWEAFRKDDIQAGKSVILLISSIFTIGLVLYILVAIATGS